MLTKLGLMNAKTPRRIGMTAYPGEKEEAKTPLKPSIYGLTLQELAEWLEAHGEKNSGPGKCGTGCTKNGWNTGTR